MTPREKAKELVSKYVNFTKQSTGANGTIYNSKQCTLITIDEIMQELDKDSGNYDIALDYWKEVKQEIEKL